MRTHNRINLINIPRPLPALAHQIRQRKTNSPAAAPLNNTVFPNEAKQPCFRHKNPHFSARRRERTQSNPTRNSFDLLNRLLGGFV